MCKTCIVMLILGLIIGGNSCGRSTEKYKVESKAMEEAKSLEKDAYKEAKNLE